MSAVPADEYLQVQPAPPLRPYVGWYSGYRQRAVAPGVHRGLPSPYLTLIFTLHEPLTIAAHPDPAQRPDRYETLIGGLHRTPALITHDGAQSGVQVALSPLGARLLLGLPAGELSGLDVPVDDVTRGLGEQVRAGLLVAGGWPARFAVLDRVLTGRLRAARDDRVAGPAPEVVRAWDVLLAGGGVIGAAELAGDVGWSGRYLASRFRQEIGLAPKVATRVVRFDRARRLLMGRAGAGSPLDLAGIALACGYADQSHLNRDFRELAGCSPTRWLAEEFGEFRFVQDEAGGGTGG